MRVQFGETIGHETYVLYVKRPKAMLADGGYIPANGYVLDP